MSFEYIQVNNHGAVFRERDDAGNFDFSNFDENITTNCKRYITTYTDQLKYPFSKRLCLFDWQIIGQIVHCNYHEN